jgi:ABC-2 family transporter protein
LTIIPIFRRELVAAARQGKQRLHAERRAFVGILFVMVVGTFTAWYYWSGWELSSATMGRISDEVLRWSIAAHCGLMGTILIRGAPTLARERERRSLDFLLVTRMSASEIVLGKLAACAVMSLSTIAAGLPVMLLLHVLGGIELRLLVLAYAAFIATILFLSAWSIWISAETPDRRTAVVLFMLCLMAWMIGPFSLSVFLPRWGIRLPGWLASVNWSLVNSSPISVVFSIATGLRSWPQLVYQVGRMIGFQLVGAVLFTTLAIVRLRPAHRALAGVDRQARRHKRRRLVWRFRPRPPVGDDAILWREKYTTRENAFTKALGLLIFGGLIIGLAAGAIHFARPAFVEVWRHGYGSARSANSEYAMSFLVQILKPTLSPGGPVDAARGEFNNFIRGTTIGIVVVMTFLVGGFASEILGVERMKETWTSLLATPMTGREIARSAIRATAWRSRWGFGTVIVLWTLGLAAGAIHPLGYVASILILAASSWLMATCGILGSIRTEKAQDGVGQWMLLVIILSCTGMLPLLLPAGLNSVLWGVGSSPLMIWTSLMSYGEAAAALTSPLNPHTPRFGLVGGERPLIVFACWLIAIVGPSLGGLWAWRYTVAHFDRLVGRPIRAAETAAASATPAPLIPALSGRGSPLAEADGAV